MDFELSNWKGEFENDLTDRPDSDLSAYAAARGLDYRGNRAQMGYVAAFPMTEELQFNVVRGVLPGGEAGVLFHEVRLREATTRSHGNHHH